VTELFPEYSQRVLLFEFWLTIPIQTIFLMASPGHIISIGQFTAFFSLSMVPSLLAIPLFSQVQSWKSKIEKRREGEG
jgi:hypothetical protein